MTSVHRPTTNGFILRSGTFSGHALSASRASGIPGVRVTSVFFNPGARTYWHRHEGGQILIVTAGAGVLGTRNGDFALSAGDVVMSPPGTEHFHGATDESLLLHEAISFGPTHWLEEVAYPLGDSPTVRKGD